MTRTKTAAISSIHRWLDRLARRWHSSHTYTSGWHRWELFDDDRNPQEVVWLSDENVLRVTDAQGQDLPQRRAALLEALASKGFDIRVFDGIGDKAVDAGDKANGDGGEPRLEGLRAREGTQAGSLDGANLRPTEGSGSNSAGDAEATAGETGATTDDLQRSLLLAAFADCSAYMDPDDEESVILPPLLGQDDLVQAELRLRLDSDWRLGISEAGQPADGETWQRMVTALAVKDPETAAKIRLHHATETNGDAARADDAAPAQAPASNGRNGSGPSEDHEQSASGMLTGMLEDGTLCRMTLDNVHGVADQMDREKMVQAALDLDELVLGPPFWQRTLDCLRAQHPQGESVANGVLASVASGIPSVATQPHTIMLDQQNRLDVRGSDLLAIDYEVACQERFALPEEVGLYLRLAQRFSALDWRACLSPFELAAGSGKSLFDIARFLPTLDEARALVGALHEGPEPDRTLKQRIAADSDRFFRPPLFGALIQLFRQAPDEWARLETLMGQRKSARIKQRVRKRAHEADRAGRRWTRQLGEEVDTAIARRLSSLLNAEEGQGSGTPPEVPASLVERYALDVFNPRFAQAKIGPRILVLDKAKQPLDLVHRRDWAERWAGLHVFAAAEDGEARLIDLAQTWLHAPGAAYVDTFVFVPNGGQPGGRLWNTGGDFIEPQDGEIPCFDRLMTACFAAEDASFILDYVADMLQDTLHPPGTYLAVKGPSTSGKSTLGDYLGTMVGSLYSGELHPAMLTDKFNAVLEGKLFVHFGEVTQEYSRRGHEFLKLIATAKKIFIERKGVDKVAIDNLLRLLITSEKDAVALTDGGLKRRTALLEMKDTLAHDPAFWQDLRREMNTGGPARLLRKLLSRQYDKRRLLRAPVTNAALENARGHLPPLQHWLLETAELGRPAGGDWPLGLEGWADGVPGRSTTKTLKTSAEAWCREHYGHRREDPPTDVAIGAMLRDLKIEYLGERRVRQNGESRKGGVWQLPDPPALLKLLEDQWCISRIVEAPERWQGDTLGQVSFRVI